MPEDQNTRNSKKKRMLIDTKNSCRYTVILLVQNSQDLITVNPGGILIKCCKSSMAKYRKFKDHTPQPNNYNHITFMKQNCVSNFINSAKNIIFHFGNTSFSIRWSSSLASTTRSLSLLSTTKIRPWVFWK
jgi:hypothetical protein